MGRHGMRMTGGQVLAGLRDGRRKAHPRPVDLAPPDPASYPATGLGRGWEPAVLLTFTLVLLCFGLVTLYSASSVMAQRDGLPDYHFVLMQASGAAIGLVVLVIAARLPLVWWRRLAWPGMILSLLLILLTVIPGTEGIAPRINGARRWLNLGVSLQPSEFAKIALIAWTAHMAVRKQEHLRSFSRGMGPFLVIWGLLLFPILLQPNLSTALILGVIGGIVLFSAGGRIAHFIFLGILLLPILLLQLREGFRAARLLAFFDPEAHTTGVGFQVQQSLIAIGSGGVTGVGFGEGRQKFGFLPEPHNDFIFAMIGEEWGLLGILFTVFLYLGIILIGFRIAARAGDLFGELLAVGFTSLLALHAMLHMWVGLGILPPTGLPLPFISWGRSNLLVSLIAIGGLMAVARARDEEPAPRKGRGGGRVTRGGGWPGGRAPEEGWEDSGEGWRNDPPGRRKGLRGIGAGILRIPGRGGAG